MTTTEQAGTPTYEELERALPDAAIEVGAGGELVIYTGWALDPKDPTAPLVKWCEVCDNGQEVPEDGCDDCGRLGAEDE